MTERQSKFTFALALLASVAASTTSTNFTNSAETAQKISIQDRTFVDSEGRQVLFHGVNAVYKVAPFIPSDGPFDAQNSINDQDIANLKSWGFNLMRLGVMWEAVETAEGVYDYDYLQKIDDLVTKLGEAGISTLIDAHQDAFARTTCGEGFPDFYAKQIFAEYKYCVNKWLDPLLVPILHKFQTCIDMDSFGFDVDENGDPLIVECQTKNFSLYYQTRQSMQGFQALYKNHLGLQDKFVNYWDVVSGFFAKNDYIVGYDPLNEPYPGDFSKDLLNIIPGKADRKFLAPLFSRVFEKYQQNDATQSMWFEPFPFPDELGVLGGQVFHVGYQKPPGGEIGSNVHVLNDHTYCCQAGLKACPNGEPNVDGNWPQKCNKFHTKRISKRSEDAERLGVPLVITEFGACITEEACTQEISQVTDLADAHLSGWAYWQFKRFQDLTTSAFDGSEGFYNNDESLQIWKVKALSRTYMPKTAGKLQKLNFNTETAHFTATFTPNSDLEAPSRLYINQELWYPYGFEISASAEGYEQNVWSTFTVDTSETNFVDFKIDTNQEWYTGQDITVEITAKQAPLHSKTTKFTQ